VRLEYTLEQNHRDIPTAIQHKYLFHIFSFLAGEKIDSRPERNPMATKLIEEVLRANARKMMSIPGVIGVGQGLCEGNPCIKVFVIKRTPELDQKIPKTLADYQVLIEEIGKIKALPWKHD
jgi:hypothetical protein